MERSTPDFNPNLDLENLTLFDCECRSRNHPPWPFVRETS
jgi:hypothetical protein